MLVEHRKRDGRRAVATRLTDAPLESVGGTNFGHVVLTSLTANGERRVSVYLSREELTRALKHIDDVEERLKSASNGREIMACLSERAP